MTEENFPKTFPILENEGCLLRLKTNVPTVTMPRIKSITTGTIPKFIDVILNFGNQVLKGDSLIHRMKRLDRKVVFYGDNTWTNLFPEMFYRSYPNSDSFYVQDFYEGDRNITNGILGLELERNHKDWDHLIAHYLGLDHIGHVEGPYSPKIHLKLKEMDSVLDEILRFSMEKEILVLVTGDHGMRSSGGHGGSTPEEIWVPLLAFNKQFKCGNNRNFNQIDLAPSLGFLLGLGIPEQSVGVLLDSLTFSFHESLEWHFTLNQHLLEKFKLKHGESIMFNMEFYENCVLGNAAFQKYKISKDKKNYDFALTNLKICSKRISEELAGGDDDFNMEMCSIGLVLVFVVSLFFYLNKHFNFFVTIEEETIKKFNLSV